MQDALPTGGISVREGENQMALFANPFLDGKEEALVLNQSGALTYVQRTASSASGWQQVSVDTSAGAPPLLGGEVAVIVNPYDLSVWAVYTAASAAEAEQVSALRLTAQTVDGVASCSWQAMPGAISFAGASMPAISRLRVAYDGTTPHVVGLTETNTLGYINPLFTIAPGGTAFFGWSVLPNPLTGAPTDSFDYTVQFGVNQAPEVYLLQGPNLSMLTFFPVFSSAPVSGTAAELVGAYQLPRGSRGSATGCVYLDAAGDLVTYNSVYGMNGPVAHFGTTSGLGLITASLWTDANRMLHVFGLDTDKTLRLLNQASWADGAPAWAQAVSQDGTTTTPALIGVHPGVAGLVLDPFPDLLPSELLWQEGTQAADMWCVCTQDVASARWAMEPIRLTDAASPIVTAAHYVSDITVLDGVGTPLGGLPVQVSAESRLEIISGGMSWLVGPGYSATLTTNRLGRIRIAVPARALVPPAIHVDAPGLVPGAVIQPASDVHEYLAGTGTLASQSAPFSGTALLAATAGGVNVVKPGTTLAEATAAATGVQQAFTAAAGKPLTSRLLTGPGPAPEIHGCAVGTMADGRVGYREFGSAKEVEDYLAGIRALPEYGGILDEFLDFLGNIWEGIKNGAIEVYNVYQAEGFFGVVIWIGGKIVEVAKVVIDGVETAGQVAEAYFNTVVQDITDALDWLQSLFDFSAIWNTKKALADGLTKVVDLGIATLDYAGTLADRWFQEKEQEVTTLFTTLKKQFATTAVGDFANITPLPPTANGSVPTQQELRGNPQATWLLNHLMDSESSGALLGRAAVSIPPDSPLVTAFTQFLQDLNASALVDDVTTTLGDLATAASVLFDPANPAVAQTTSVLALLNDMENLALDVLQALDTLVNKILGLAATIARSVDDLLDSSLDLLGPIGSLIQWILEEVDGPDIDQLTLGDFLLLVIAFYVTTLYKLFYGVDEQPFPTGVFPLLPGPPSATGVAGDEPDPDSMHTWQLFCGFAGVFNSLLNFYGDLCIMWDKVDPVLNPLICIGALLTQVLSGVALSAPPVTGREWEGPATGAFVAQLLEWLLGFAVCAASLSEVAEADTVWLKNLNGIAGPVVNTLFGVANLACLAADDAQAKATAYTWGSDMVSVIGALDSVIRIDTGPEEPDESLPWRVGITAGVNVGTNLTAAVMTIVSGVTRTRPEITFDSLDPIAEGTAGQPFVLDVKKHTTGGDKPCNRPLQKFTMTGAEGSGLTIDPDTGQVTGTPTSALSYDVTFTVSDSNCPAYESEAVTGKITIGSSLSAPPHPRGHGDHHDHSGHHDHDGHKHKGHGGHRADS
ncbi:Ig domain-containing protein [Streptacidiphilus sp. N1-12]|uniref:Ig domain-containing protein n=2 Tax=Streptacidiphilus alkalitolerans TaxID=3342712 RepID=A0ABV6VHS0_9ACTN